MKLEPKPVKLVPQTSKTILFEKFNDEKPSLARILKLDVDDLFTDKELNIIADKLEVGSFKEFIDKFEPVIYQMSYEEDGKPVFKYSLDYMEGAEPVYICKHAFYEMVIDLIAEKSKSGKSNLDASYKKIEALLSPEAELKRAKGLRIEMKTCYETAMDYQNNNRDDEADRYFEKCEKIMDETVKRYQKSAVSLLPLAIADMQSVINQRIIALPDNQNDDVQVITGKTQERLPCRFEWNEKGEFEAVPAGDVSEAEQSEEKNNISGYLTENWEAAADDIDSIAKSESMKKMFLRCYSEEKTNALAVVPVDQLIEKQRSYIDIYKDAQQSFMDSVGELVQKVINVEMFFKHAADKNGDLPSNAKLIIANSTVDEILNQETKLRKYLSAVNNSNSEKIWMAVLPPVDGENDLMDEVKSAGTGRLRRPGVKKSETVSYNTETSFSSAKGLISILREYKILSFFNFRACEKTGFSGLSEKVAEAYMNAVESMDNKDRKFAVVAYPNFNVIPKSERKIKINSKISGDGFDPIEENWLRIPVVYIDAAYIAAGTIAATQNQKILKSKGYKICDDNPCVRFDIEKDDNNFRFKTIFNCEQKLNGNDEAVRKINENMLGVCFSDADAVFEGSKVTNTYIKFARTCSGKPVYNTLTMMFVGCYFNVFSKKDQIISMVNKLKDYCKEQELENPDCDNKLLCTQTTPPENIDFDSSEKKIVITFGKATEFVDDLRIEDSDD